MVRDFCLSQSKIVVKTVKGSIEYVPNVINVSLVSGLLYIQILFFLILILRDALCSEIIYQIKYSHKMLSTKKTHFSFHQILAFATVVNLVQLDSVLLLPPQGFRPKSEIPRMYPSSSRG